jgi:hypothetical protein
MTRDFEEERRWQLIMEEMDRLHDRLSPEVRAITKEIYSQSPLFAMMYDRSPGYAKRLAEVRRRHLEENKDNILPHKQGKSDD